MIASMSGQASAGTRSFFQREIEALETTRPRSVRSSARRVDPPASAQALLSGVVMVDSISVKQNDTSLSRIPKLRSCNDESRLYAQPMGFEERLRQAREAAKLTGEALGTKLGVSKQTISHWENGRYQPSLEQLEALCDELAVTTDWMMGRQNADLSPEALLEARYFDALSAEDKRRWRTMRQAMFSPA